MRATMSVLACPLKLAHAHVCLQILIVTNDDISHRFIFKHIQNDLILHIMLHVNIL